MMFNNDQNWNNYDNKSFLDYGFLKLQKSGQYLNLFMKHLLVLIIGNIQKN